MMQHDGVLLQVVRKRTRGLHTISTASDGGCRVEERKRGCLVLGKVCLDANDNQYFITSSL